MISGIKVRPGRDLALIGLMLLGASVLSACKFEESITPIAWPTGSPESGVVVTLSSEEATLSPSERETSVQQAIDDGDYQLAIELVVDLYNIDISDAAGMPQYSSGMGGAYATTDPRDGSILVGPGAFSSSAILATSIGHEVIHTKQMAEGRAYLAVDDAGEVYPISEQGYYINELEAWKWESEHAEENGLPEGEIEIIQDAIDSYYNLLTDENKELADRGTYVLPDVEPAAP